MATEHWIVTPLYSPVPPMQVSAASPQLELGRAQLRLDELDDLHLRFTISGARLQVLILGKTKTVLTIDGCKTHTAKGKAYFLTHGSVIDLQLTKPQSLLVHYFGDPVPAAATATTTTTTTTITTPTRPAPADAATTTTTTSMTTRSGSMTRARSSGAASSTSAMPAPTATPAAAVIGGPAPSAVIVVPPVPAAVIVPDTTPPISPSGDVLVVQPIVPAKLKQDVLESLRAVFPTMSQRTLSGVFDKIALERQKQQPAPDAKQVDEIEEYHSYLTAATNHILNNEMSVDDSEPVVTGGRLTGRKRPADTPIELLEGQELQDDDGDDDDDDVEVHEGGAPRDKSPEQLRIELLHEHLQALFAVFPDCDEHFLYQKLLEYDSNDVTRVDRVDLICNALLEKRDYPKRKAPEPTKPTLSEEEAYKEQENTFKSTTRTVSPLYRQLVVHALSDDFRLTPLPYIRKVAAAHQNCYYPTFLALEKEINAARDASETEPIRDIYDMVNAAKLPYSMLKIRRNLVNITKTADTVDPVFLEEHQFIRAYIAKVTSQRDQMIAKAINQKLSRESGDIIECVCCLEEVTFEDVATCEDGHLVCQDCARKATEAVLDSGKTNLRCLYPGCTFGYARSEMKRFLDTRTFDFFMRRVQAEELRAVGISNLESCPFCEYACIIENDADRVFKCQNPKCMKESCRLCKEESHIPLRCDEVEKKIERDMRMFVTEQMSEALIRECPKCHTRFFKEEGCNHMVCPCGVHMCYLCRGVIPGYEHFSNNKDDTSKCPLYSDTVKLNNQMVATAATTALTTYVDENPEAAAARLEVLKLPPGIKVGGGPPAPVAAPAAPAAGAAAPALVVPGFLAAVAALGRPLGFGVLAPQPMPAMVARPAVAAPRPAVAAARPKRRRRR